MIGYKTGAEKIQVELEDCVVAKRKNAQEKDRNKLRIQFVSLH